MAQVIIVDPEFKGLIPEPTEEEKAGLEKSILEEGCRDPLVLWDDILLDGHNRYEICTRNEIDYKTVMKTFDNRDQAKIWIIANQLSRRNLNPEQTAYLIGMRYKLEKKAIPNPEGAGGKAGKIVRGQNDPQQTTAEKIAKEVGVSARTVKRDAAFADAVDKLSEKEKKEVLAGNSDKTKEEIINNLAEGLQKDGVDFGKNKPKRNKVKPQNVEGGDSLNLYNLKKYWKKTSKKDKAAFLEWIKTI